MLSTAVITVGTSLFTTLAELGNATSAQAWVAGREAQRQALADRLEDVERLRRAVERRDWRAAGEMLAQLPPDLPAWGAEVATWRALRNEPECRNVHKLVLLASDTAAGGAAATALAGALEAWERLPVRSQVVADLDPTFPARFKVGGLRNLVSELVQVVRESRPDTPIFVVSGGFKAQVAVTAVVGQMLGVPVAYRFEEFPDTIWLPPLPVRLDEEAVAPLADVLWRGEITDADLRARLGSPLTEANPAWAMTRTLLVEDRDEQGQVIWRVSPLGQLALELYGPKASPKVDEPRSSHPKESGG